MATKRKDKSRVVLKTGEVQRKDGTYQFSWQDSQMKRRFVYARTLDDLREKRSVFRKINVMVLRLKHDTQPLMNYLTFGQI